MIQLGGFLGRLLEPLLETGLLLRGNVLKLLAKRALVTAGLTAATDVTTQKKIFGSGLPSDLASQTILIISKREKDEIMKIVTSIKKICLMIEGCQ